MDTIDHQRFEIHSPKAEDKWSKILKPTWTGYNQTHSTVDPPKSTVGYVPIIQAPAHEVDTLNTVAKRALEIAHKLEQRYAVLTVDEGLSQS